MAGTMIRVLLVDDDPGALALHRAFLDELGGFRVVGAAADEASGSALLRSVEADLLLLDVELPDGSGLRVLNELRASGGTGLDVIMITAANDAAVVDRAMLHSVSDYLVKPFLRTEFQQRMRRYARERRQRAAGAGFGPEAGAAGMSQRDIDSKLGRPSSPERLPKGMSESSLDLVRTVFAVGSEELSSAQVSERSGMSRVSARRYLSYLARSGEILVRSRYGQAGRPEHRYRRAD
ncbi:MAG: response regulator [Renibacterium sp.]|nr:response regulator [Renibacterium sp.]